MLAANYLTGNRK